MAAAIGAWDMAKSGLYLLLLQLVAINIAGAVVFRLFGLGPRGVRYARGRAWLGRAAWAVALAATVGLTTFQLWEQPDYQRSSRSRRAAADVQQAVNDSGVARLVEANVRFTRSDTPGKDALLVVTYVQPTAPGATDAELRRRLASAIQTRLLQQGFDVQPHVSVNVVQ